MTNENGTPAQQRKRVRIDEEVTVLAKKPANNTPSNAASELTSRAVASHPEPIQVLAKAISREYNALRSRQRQQEASLAKLKEDSFIPRSARVAFSLTAPDRVMDTDAFKLHKATVDAALKVFQTALKKSIVETANLVNEDMKKSTGELFVKSIIDICTLIVISKGLNSKNNHRCAYYMTSNYLDDSLFTSTWTTRQDVAQKIKTSDAEDTMDIEDPLATADTNAIATNYTFDATETQIWDTLKLPTCDLLKAIFVDSWASQLAVYKKKEMEINLAVAAKKIMGTDATNKASQELDKEQTAGPKKIKDLIDTAVQKKTKHLQTELNKLSQKVQRTKNSSGGTNRQPNRAKGAPSTKKDDNENGGKKGGSKKQGNGSAQPNRDGHTPAKKGNASATVATKKTQRRSLSPAQKKKIATQPRSNKKSRKSTGN